MNVADEKFKFRALLSLVSFIPDSLHKELEFQQLKMLEIGISGEEINHLIHDNHSREGITRHRALLTLTDIRRQAGIPDPYSMRNAKLPGQLQATIDDADAYLRLKGGRRKHPSPPISSPPPQRFWATRPREVEGLAVPYGINSHGVLVCANDADSTEPYHCLSCAAPLTLKAGDLRVRHFAHNVGSRCDGESVLHQIAKELVAQVINEMTRSAKELRLSCTCRKCRKQFDTVLGSRAFDRAVNEVQEGAFRCDVMAYRGDSAVLAIEVINTHAVDQAKGEALRVAWIELDAKDIINDPYYWKPTQERLKDTLCPDCRDQARKIKAVANKRGQLLPNDPYVGAVVSCYKCSEDIVLYWWPGVPFAETAPPSPAPSSIKYASSRAYGGKYWANTCPCCSAIQGDNFVFLDASSPFASLSMRDVGQAMPRLTFQVEGATALFKQKLLKSI
ncbi:hypothetical protein GTP23_21315 [Pseudoduganella sp. FT93W]|uniref:Competence protein CoiA-like N-terminal domain-containing protein n=1 Tax=Duganella fentianensis TaxID=2692177 RepID=A0A845I741_9BURK|nr:competence protein CoiA family protein [Duganella fentianensis]MYN47588.1 hypothetical protein [Duganella fentianensis]